MLPIIPVWIFKTWEGELLMVAFPGTIPEKFIFTVRDELVAQTIQGVLGERVVVTYNEHKGIPTRFLVTPLISLRMSASRKSPLNCQTFQGQIISPHILGRDVAP